MEIFFSILTILFFSLAIRGEEAKSWREVNVRELKELEPVETTRPVDFSLCSLGCATYLAQVGNHGARFGHYFENWFSSLKISKMMNLTLLYHEFTPNNLIPAASWEKFLGLGRHFEDYSSICLHRKLNRSKTLGYLADECQEFDPCLHVVQLPTMNSRNKQKMKNTIQSEIDKEKHCHTVLHLKIDQMVTFRMPPEEEEALNAFVKYSYYDAREKYPIPCQFNRKNLNIAVHVRRGDVSENSLGRYFSNEMYNSTIMAVKSLLEELNYIESLGRNEISVHIFSEGSRENFGPLQNITGINFHLNENLFDTIHHMAIADILIGSYSGFSSYAKRISRGLLLFPYQTSHKMIKIQKKDGSFDKAHFIKLWNSKLDDLKVVPCWNK